MASRTTSRAIRRPAVQATDPPMGNQPRWTPLVSTATRHLRDRRRDVLGLHPGLIRNVEDFVQMLKAAQGNHEVAQAR